LALTINKFSLVLQKETIAEDGTHIRLKKWAETHQILCVDTVIDRTIYYNRK